MTFLDKIRAVWLVVKALVHHDWVVVMVFSYTGSGQWVAGYSGRGMREATIRRAQVAAGEEIADPGTRVVIL